MPFDRATDLSFLKSSKFQQALFTLVLDNTEQGNVLLNIRGNYLVIQTLNASAGSVDMQIDVLINGVQLIPNIITESISGNNAELKNIQFKVELNPNDEITFRGTSSGLPTDTIDINWILSGI